MKSIASHMYVAGSTRASFKNSNLTIAELNEKASKAYVEGIR